MARRIQASRFPGQVTSVAANHPPAAGETFSRGHAVRLDASGELEKHPLLTTVVDIYGFSNEDVASGVPSSPGGEANVEVADDRIFVGQCHTSGAVATDLSAVFADQTYGLIELSGTQLVDLDDTTNVVVQIVDVDDELDLVWFRVIPSARQLSD